MTNLTAGFYKDAYALSQYMTLPVWKQPLLKKAFEIFGKNPVILVDCSHKVIGEYHEGDISYHRWNKILETSIFPYEWIDAVFHRTIALLTRKNIAIQSRDYGASTWLGSIIRNNICYGFLSVLEERRPLSAEDIELFKYICDIAAARLAETDTNSLRETFYGPLLRDILEKRIAGQKELENRMLTRNWALKSHYCVICIEIPIIQDAPPRFYVTKRLAELFKHVITFEHQDKVFVLVEASALDHLLATCELLYAQIKTLRLRAGVSEVFGDLLQLPCYYNQAKRALILGGKTDLTILFYDIYKLEDFFSEIIQKLPQDQFYHNAVLALLKFDKENGSSLSATLHSYLLSDKSVTRCSKALHLHKNTVAAHIEKIKNITDNNLADPLDTFHMLLTYELLKRFETESKLPL